MAASRCHPGARGRRPRRKAPDASRCTRCHPGTRRSHARRSPVARGSSRTRCPDRPTRARRRPRSCPCARRAVARRCAPRRRRHARAPWRRRRRARTVRRTSSRARARMAGNTLSSSRLRQAGTLSTRPRVARGSARANRAALVKVCAPLLDSRISASFPHLDPELVHRAIHACCGKPVDASAGPTLARTARAMPRSTRSVGANPNDAPHVPRSPATRASRRWSVSAQST